MKRSIIAVLSLGTAALASIAILTVPAMVINTSVPAISVAETLLIRGEASYRQRIALPDHSNLIVQLVDITSPDGPFPVMAENVTTPKGQVPLDFDLPIDKSKLDATHKYGLQARIVVGDVLWFVSDERLPVDLADLTHQYKINLGMVNQTTSIKQEVPTHINAQEWLVEDLFGGGVIDSSHITVKVADKADASEQRGLSKYDVNGTGGCNRYKSTVTINESEKTIDFATPAMTFMACAEAISQQEYRFVDMLGKASSYEFDDIGRLFLKDGDGKYIARLVPNL